MTQSRATRPRTLTKIVDFSLAAWNTVATHKLFEVEGTLVDVQLFARTITALTSGGGATISAGVASDIDTFYTLDQIAGRGAVANKIWLQAADESTEPVMSDVQPAPQAISEDVVYAIGTAAMLTGLVEFTLRFTPLADATVEIADGSAP